MENFLKDEENKFAALFEYASMGIVVTDANGVIMMVNQFLLGQFGYGHISDLIDQSIEVLIPARYEKAHQVHRENYSKNPEKRTMGVGRDLFARKKDGSEFPVEVSLSNYASKEGMHMIAFVVDITKRKEIEKSVTDQKELLEKTNHTIEGLNDALEEKVSVRTGQLQDALNQIEASRDELTKALSKEKELGDLKSRFVSMASHEFRTPLSTILSSASLLAKYTETEEQEKRDKHIQRIKGSVSNLTDILNEFLSIGKIEDGKIEVRYTHFNIKEFVEILVAEMQGNAKGGQQILYSHQGVEWFNLDMSLFRNICLNLLSNAVKFSNEKGIISVQSLVDTNGFSLKVEDNGIGIATKDQEHLFERFFRASNVTNIQGTGLGLHIISKYIELMNGTIGFKSELEKGTTFTIEFPINQQL